MAGSSNLHPARVLQLNEAGPLISSFKKSVMSEYFPFKQKAPRHPTNTNEILTYTPILSTDKPSRHTATLDLLASIQCRIGIIARHILRAALFQSAIERLDLCCPELERACLVVAVAAKRHLWRASGEHVNDLAVWHNLFYWAICDT
jgi:hypothetical protein